MTPRKKKQKRKRRTARKKPRRDFFPQELLDRLRKRMENEQSRDDSSLAPIDEDPTVAPRADLPAGRGSAKLSL
jgi:hypothetical protein